jgi:putative DNA methylase
MTHPIKSPRKLIEVALPLDAINVASALEKQPFTRHHPRSLHIWWARRPFTAARAVIFAQLVNDPGYQQGGGFKYGKNKKEAAIERKRLFDIIEELVLWDNTDNEAVLGRARAEIRRSWREVCELNKDHPQAAELFDPDRLPGLHDPFAGGGAIPLEAQRLGLEAYASDLNPVAVLINKAMIEIPPKFAGQPPVRTVAPEERGARLDLTQTWPGATGLAEDVLHYGNWIGAEAHKRIGSLYPPVEITSSMAHNRPDLKSLVGQKLKVIAWIWARTVKSPNPAFSHVEVPLASGFVLSSKEGKEAYVQPVVEGDHYRFTVKMGPPPPEANTGTKLSRGANFSCLASGVPIDPNYIKSEAIANRMGAKMMAVVVAGPRKRIYLEPTTEMEKLAAQAQPRWRPDGSLVDDARAFTPTLYGLKEWRDLFTPRQTVALTTFSDLVAEAREKISQDAVAAGLPDDGKGLDAGGSGATAYAEAISVYLAIAVSRWADMNNSICTWNTTNANIRALFSRQAIQMTWDFAELSAFAPLAGFDSVINSFAELTQSLPAAVGGFAEQADAQTQRISSNKTVSTDPPYYDNVPYADLSDFFYTWLRRMLKPTFPNLFSTLAVPKADELVALTYRHGGTDGARKYFLNGMTQAMRNLADQAHPEGPITIYYAFKQSDTESEVGTASTGWETFLEAVNQAGMQLTGTWPMRTERAQRSRGIGSNALASSIILVCRKRPIDAATVSRREFLRELNSLLPEALDEMTKGSGDDRSPVAPVDLSQAIIGPGMAVFSKYEAVLEADGSQMSVRTALQLINRFLAEDDFDPDTQFCLHWFEQYGWKDGKFGDADTLARAKGTSVDGVKAAGVAASGSGIVRLRKWSEYPEDWDPKNDARNPVWETLHHLIRALKQEGETGAGRLLGAVRGKAEAARQLAYRLYTLCERQGWAEDARAYNELITSWSGIESVAGTVPSEIQGSLFE